MDFYDPIRDLCDAGRRMAEVWSNWGMDFHPAYAEFLATVDRVEMWLEDPDRAEVG